MKILSWEEIEDCYKTGYKPEIFINGSGISVGSFDGLHLGHRTLISNLVDNCSKRNIIPGVVSFTKALPGIKNKNNYPGDISTLNQRLKLFQELGIQFAIIIDFNEKFASLSGVEFLNILNKVCNMKFISEGVDFKFGYKGATDISAIRDYAENNQMSCSFVNQVIFDDSGVTERVSSSCIRNMIRNGDFTTVEKLLLRKYEVELLESDFNFENNQIYIERNCINQVLPADGLYLCSDEKNQQVSVNIDGLRILLSKKASRICF